MIARKNSYRLGPSFDTEDTAQAVAAYLVKTIPFCRDYGVDVVDTTRPLPPGVIESRYSARYVLVTDDCIRTYQTTLEHISHCVTDFVVGMRAGIEIAEKRAQAAAGQPVAKPFRPMCPMCRRYKGVVELDTVNGVFRCNMCEHMFKRAIVKATIKQIVSDDIDTPLSIAEYDVY